MKIDALQATTADGVTLRGEIVRGDDTWVVLLHDAGGDLDDWRPIRAGLARRGWTVLALDLRGHGGSDGEWVPERGLLDVDLGITVARRSNARHVAVVCSGIAGILALQAVERAWDQEMFELPDSLVLISPGPLDGEDPMTLRGRGLSRLFVHGAADPLADDTLALQRASIGWNVTVSYATAAHGAALVSELPRNVLDKIVAFLKEQRTLRGPGRRRWEERAARGGRSLPPAHSG
jgi:pimeloyl-ACP methyl ester carboxylesterase